MGSREPSAAGRVGAERGKGEGDCQDAAKKGKWKFEEQNVTDGGNAAEKGYASVSLTCFFPTAGL